MFAFVPDETWKLAVLLVIVFVMIVVIYLEFKYLRRKRIERERGKATNIDDQAHNALITTKAIASALGRTGVRSEEASSLIREAEASFRMGDGLHVIEVTAKARDALMKEKQRQQQLGDLAKMPEPSAPPSESEPTTKEALQEKLPKNYVPAKFMLDSARIAIDERRSRGKSVVEAERLLGLAQKSFDEKDYDASLKHGLQARKATEDIVAEVEVAAPVEVSVTVETEARTCKSCGTQLKPDDSFCRKCGVKVEILVCRSCGTRAKEGDTFCRKCGVALT